MSEAKERVFEFGSFRVNAVKRLLMREGEPVSLAPKAFDILLLLVENSGRILEKSEMIESIWPDSFVEEINLNVHISALRKALGESPDEHRYIVTVPRRGFSFVASVSELDIEEAALENELADQTYLFITERADGEEQIELTEIGLPAVAEPVALRRRFEMNRPILAGLVAVILMGLAFSYFLISNKLDQAKTSENTEPFTIPALRALNLQDLSVPGRRSIAVLPFKLLNPEAEEYLGIGMADALITKLSNIKQILVRPTSAVLKYDGLDTNLVNVGRELGVETVLEGKVQRAGDRVRVTVQIVRVEDGVPLWAETFDDYVTDIFAVQDSISGRVAETLTTKLTGEEKKLLSKHYTENHEAYQAYLKGLYFWNKRTKRGFKKAIKYFNKAIEQDPNYALAYAGLADSYNLISQYSAIPREETYPKAKAAALKALKLDDTLAEAHTSLASISEYERNWDTARKEYKRALELNPNYPTAHHWYAIFLVQMGELDKALPEIRRAYELDPLSIAITRDFGEILYYARLYDRAIEQSRRAIEMDGHFRGPRVTLGLSYMQKGIYDKASTELKRVRAFPEIAYLNAAVGNKEKAIEMLNVLKKEHEKNPAAAFPIALIYAGLGEKDESLSWLEIAYKDRALPLMAFRGDPRLDPLRSDSRFADLSHRITFSP